MTSASTRHFVLAGEGLRPIASTGRATDRDVGPALPKCLPPGTVFVRTGVESGLVDDAESSIVMLGKEELARRQKLRADALKAAEERHHEARKSDATPSGRCVPICFKLAGQR